MSEQLPIPTDNEHKQETGLLNRRRVLKGAAALALLSAGIGSYGLNKLRTNTGDMPSNESPLSDTTPMSTEVPPNSESEQITPMPLGDAEQLRQMVENETPEAYLKHFWITTENAPSESAIGARLADLVQEWVTAGCNPIDVASQGTLDEYQAAMASKYGVLAAAGLSGVEQPEDIDITAVENSLLYKTINELHMIILEKYMNAAREGSTDSLSFNITPKSNDQTSQGGVGSYGMAINLEVTYWNGKDESMILNGPLGVDIQNKDITNPSEEESAKNVRIQAISLDEQKTEQFS